jgi:hypothetical protein
MREYMVVTCWDDSEPTDWYIVIAENMVGAVKEARLREEQGEVEFIAILENIEID